MKVFIFALVALVAIHGSHSFSRPCGANPFPTSVTSNNCDATSCTVNRGQSLTATAVFTPTQAHSSVTRTYVANVGGIDITLASGEACAQINGGCPIAAGSSTTWNINVPIDNSLPALQGVPVRGKRR